MKGSKIGALMVLALFLFSMVPVLAQDGNVQQHGKDITEPQHQQELRERALSAQSSFGDVKAKIINNRAQVAKCLTNGGTSECASLLAQDVTNRKDYLFNAIDRATAVLENLREKAHNIADTTERDEMIAHIDDRINELHELAQKVESVEDREGLKSVRDEFVYLYKLVKEDVNQYRLSTRLETMHGINQKLVSLNARIGHIADNLEAKGATLGEDYPVKYQALQDAVAEAEKRLEDARVSYQHAIDLKASVEEVQAAILEGKTYLAQVKERVQAARGHVSDILQAFRNRAGSNQLSEAIAETATEE